ncbi:MAG: YdcF family protein [Synechococcaceae cyanobacterium]|jgi:hypothetical protein
MARTALPRGTSRPRRRQAVVPPRPGRAAGPLPAAPRRRPRRPRPAGGHWIKLSLLLMALGLLWLSRGRWWPSPPPPQMILVLGGDRDREMVAARLSRQDGLPVVVSGGTNPEYARWVFLERAGLPANRVLLDYRAQDTFTNFTSLVDDLRRAHVRHALLVTSSDHMDRALLVGRIVAGSRGIHLTPVPVACGDLCVHEGRGKILGDGVRAAFWVVSGRDLRSLFPHWRWPAGGDRHGVRPGSESDPRPAAD